MKAIMKAPSLARRYPQHRVDPDRVAALLAPYEDEFRHSVKTKGWVYAGPAHDALVADGDEYDAGVFGVDVTWDVANLDVRWKGEKVHLGRFPDVGWLAIAAADVHRLLDLWRDQNDTPLDPTPDDDADDEGDDE